MHYRGRSSQRCPDALGLVTQTSINVGRSIGRLVTYESGKLASFQTCSIQTRHCHVKRAFTLASDTLQSVSCPFAPIVHGALFVSCLLLRQCHCLLGNCVADHLWCRKKRPAPYMISTHKHVKTLTARRTLRLLQNPSYIPRKWHFSAAYPVRRCW